MRLTSSPEDAGANTKQAWDALFDVYGNEAFHPIEGRGVLMTVFASRNVRRSEAIALMQRMIDKGYAIAP